MKISETFTLHLDTNSYALKEKPSVARAFDACGKVGDKVNHILCKRLINVL